MSIVKLKEIYSVVFRYENSLLKGAHVGFKEVVREDNEILHQKELPVVPVSIGEQEGFPLKELLDIVLIDSLKRIESLEGVIIEKETVIEGLNAIISNKNDVINKAVLVLEEKDKTILLLQEEITKLSSVISLSDIQTTITDDFKNFKTKRKIQLTDDEVEILKNPKLSKERVELLKDLKLREFEPASVEAVKRAKSSLEGLISKIKTREDFETLEVIDFETFSMEKSLLKCKINGEFKLIKT